MGKMRKPLLYVFVFYLLGIAVFNRLYYVFFGAASAALFLIMYIKNNRNLALYCLIFFAFGMTCIYGHDYISRLKYEKIKSTEYLRGYVTTVEKNMYSVKNYRDNYNVMLSLDRDIGIVPGNFVVFRGEVREKPEYKKRIMDSQGIGAYISCRYYNMQVYNKNSILLIPYKVRFKLNKALTQIDKIGGAFISGLITGCTSDMSDKDTKAFGELGISHILAVSGFNIGIIYLILTLLLKKLSARLRYSTTLFVCFIYTAIGGFEPSITRAFIMIAAATAAKLLNRYYDVLNGVILTAFIMLVLNPYSLYNPGFRFSFLATLGIILLKDDIKDKLPEWIKRTRDELSVGLGALIMVFPLILWYSGGVSVFFIIINLLLSPAVAFSTILGFASSVIYLATGIKLILYPSVFIGLILVKLTATIANYNYLILIGRTSIAFMIVYYLMIAIQFEFIKLGKKLNIKLIKSIGLAAMLILLFIRSSDLKIHMLNVGQGDSMLIETPDRKLILIDTGPEFRDYSAAASKVVPYIRRLGYKKIDLLLISHFHNDHSGGLEYITQNLRVNKIAAFEENEKIKDPIIKVSKGDEIKSGELRLNILSPDYIEGKGDDKNETCLVIELLYKNFSMLLTADAKKTELDSIAPGDYDILKVSHHGSFASFSTRLVDYSNFKSALISVGKNSFGHPSRETVNYLEEKNIDIYRTDLNGDIVVDTNGRVYKILVQ